MEILFLGTCACDFSERLESDLKFKFDKDVRRSSAMLIDGRFLVDCGVHTLNSLEIANIAPSDITDIFITHTHRDHFNADNINAIASSRTTPLRVWINSNANTEMLKNVEIKPLEYFQKGEICDGCTVVSLPANHDPIASPQHFYFEINGKKTFYGCDGAWLFNRTYYYLKDKRLDLCVLDCTSGDYDGDFRMGEHNSIPMLRVMLPSLRTFKVIDEASTVYFSHLAPSLHASHDETVKIAEKIGASVAYDGLKITV